MPRLTISFSCTEEMLVRAKLTGQLRCLVAGTAILIPVATVD